MDRRHESEHQSCGLGRGIRHPPPCGGPHSCDSATSCETRQKDAVAKKCRGPTSWLRPVGVQNCQQRPEQGIWEVDSSQGPLAGPNRPSSGVAPLRWRRRRDPPPLLVLSPRCLGSVVWPAAISLNRHSTLHAIANSGKRRAFPRAIKMRRVGSGRTPVARGDGWETMRCPSR